MKKNSRADLPEAAVRAASFLPLSAFAIHAKTIAALALKHGLATAIATRESAAAGILLNLRSEPYPVAQTGCDVCR
jgi:hypothetical protein